MVKCWSCGAVVKSEYEYRFVRFYCDACREEKEKREQEEKVTFNTIKNNMMLERAIRRIEDYEYAGNPISHYREAIDTIAEYIRENPRKVQSTEECITLITILAEREYIKCQHQVDKYKIDFYLPEHKIYLEIDGMRHNKLKDAKRDLDILRLSESGHDVVRLPTSFVNAFPKRIHEAVFAIRAKKQAFRLENEAPLVEEMAAVLDEREAERKLKRDIKKSQAAWATGVKYSEIK